METPAHLDHLTGSIIEIADGPEPVAGAGIPVPGDGDDGGDLLLELPLGQFEGRSVLGHVEEIEELLGILPDLELTGLELTIPSLLDEIEGVVLKIGVPEVHVSCPWR